jgi:uroporphyrinogen-III decarboxylase
VERCFRTAGTHGFCLASSSSILPETPIENIEAFLTHGKEFGTEFLGGNA